MTLKSAVVENKGLTAKVRQAASGLMIYTFLNPKGGVGWTHGSRFAAMVRTAFALLVVFLCVLSGALAAVNDEPQFIFNTFSFLVWGGLVMWMAAGFTMLESGSIRVW